MAPEIDMQVGAAIGHQFSIAFDEACHHRLARLADILLTHIRWIGDDGIEPAWQDRRALAIVVGQFDQLVVRCCFKKICALDTRVVALVDQFSRCEINGRQMRREVGYVGAEDPRDQFAMAKVGLQIFLARVGAHEKGPTTTPGIENSVIAIANAKGVYQVYDLRSGIVLAIFVPFLRRDQLLENATNNVIVQLRKIELVDVLQHTAPSFDSAGAQKRNAIAEIPAVEPEDRFVVATEPLGARKEGVNLIKRFVASADAGSEPQRWHAGKPLLQRLIKNELVDRRVAGELGGPLDVVGAVQTERPALILAHPAINLGGFRLVLVAFEQRPLRFAYGSLQEAFQGLHKVVVG